jgi:putative ABC transport system permease protein
MKLQRQILKLLSLVLTSMTNSGLETNLGRNFTGFDIDNNNYVCVVGSDFGKGLLKDINPIDKTISMRCPVQSDRYPKRERLHFGNKQDLRVLIPIQVARSLFTAPNINYTMSIMVSKRTVRRSHRPRRYYHA